MDVKWKREAQQQQQTAIACPGPGMLVKVLRNISTNHPLETALFHSDWLKKRSFFSWRGKLSTNTEIGWDDVELATTRRSARHLRRVAALLGALSLSLHTDPYLLLLVLADSSV